MFTFTDAFGTPVDAAVVRDIASSPIQGSDIRNLPVLIKAAIAADEAGYCGVYDDIASAIGGPTRDDLRDLGLLTRSFNVRGTRTVTVTLDIEIPFELDSVEASRPADIRDGDVDLSDYFSSESITGETLRDAINRYGYYDTEVEGSYEIERVWTD